MGPRPNSRAPLVETGRESVLRGRFLLPGTLSLGWHLALFAWIGAGARVPTVTTETAPRAVPEPELVELFRDDDVVGERVFPDEKPDDRQVVQTEDAPDRRRPESDKHLSDRDQVVETPTKARMEGEFRSFSEAGGAESESPRLSGSGEEQPAGNLSMSELGVFPSGGPGIDGVFEGDLAFHSATDDYLPDVPLGDRTLLSTRWYAHWTYLRRIRKQIAPGWNRQIRRIVKALAVTGHEVNRGEKITKVLVELSRTGEIEDVSVVRSSGSRAIDMVAVGAFREARSFPNPPKELIRADDTIRIRWTFVVNVVRPKAEFASTERTRERKRD